MMVRVLFFGATADEAETPETTIEIADGSRIDAAVDEILASHPSLVANRSRGHLLIALNEEYASGNEQVREGDTVAVFTAVSGG